MHQTRHTMSPHTSFQAFVGKWFGYSRLSDRDQRESEITPRPRQTSNQPDYGAYNEAFVIHHWASFGTRF